MDKIKLELKTPAKVTIDYRGFSIELDPFLTIAEQIVIINNYLDEYFTKPSDKENTVGYSYLDAEYMLMSLIYQLKTNIDTSAMENDDYAHESLFNIVTLSIHNYNDFRKKLDKIVEIKEKELVLENSVGSILSYSFEKLNSILDKVGETTPEQLENLQKIGIGLVERLEKSSVLTGTPKKTRKKAENVGEA